uniref:Capsid protein n=1 Tax=Guangdong fish caecilians hepevirus TaxID=2116394 RepID=A0A2P1GMQ5_9VIRU|nr:capsid protein [Guangdong fish caecilians hepevirus]
MSERANIVAGPIGGRAGLTGPGQPRRRGRRGRSRGRSRSRSRSRSRGRVGRRGRVSVAGKLLASAQADASALKVLATSQARRVARGARRRPTIERVERQIASLKLKVDGPKVEKVMHGSLTVGILRGNDADELSRAFHVNLNPLLLKEATATAAITPLGDTAKDYALWRCVKCAVHLVPMVGSAVVAGTIALVSLDNDGQAAKLLTLDSVMSRPFKEVPLGSALVWRAPMRQLEGPREGWWLMDTNDSAIAAFGPAVDVHLFGATYDLLNTTGVMERYPGPLWIAQLQYTYEFSNWEPKPGLSTLIKAESPADRAVFSTDAGGNLIVELVEAVGINGRHRRVLTSATALQLEPAEGLGSTIWQVVGNAAEAAADVLPGPWSWLVRGGLWFARRLFGTTAARVRLGQVGPAYKVYASLEDAQRDVGCINPVATTYEVPYTHFVVSQCNSTNVQFNTESVAGGSTVATTYPIVPGGPMQNPLLANDGSIIPDRLQWARWIAVGYSVNAATLFMQARTCRLHCTVQPSTLYPAGAWSYASGDTTASSDIQHVQLLEYVSGWVPHSTIAVMAHPPLVCVQSGPPSSNYGVIGDFLSLAKWLRDQPGASAGGFTKLVSPTIYNAYDSGSGGGDSQYPLPLTPGSTWVAPVYLLEYATVYYNNAPPNFRCFSAADPLPHKDECICALVVDVSVGSVTLYGPTPRNWVGGSYQSHLLVLSSPTEPVTSCTRGFKRSKVVFLPLNDHCCSGSDSDSDVLEPEDSDGSCSDFHV